MVTTALVNEPITCILRFIRILIFGHQANNGIVITFISYKAGFALFDFLLRGLRCGYFVQHFDSMWSKRLQWLRKGRVLDWETQFLQWEVLCLFCWFETSSDVSDFLPSRFDSHVDSLLFLQDSGLHMFLSELIFIAVECIEGTNESMIVFGKYVEKAHSHFTFRYFPIHGFQK